MGAVSTATLLTLGVQALPTLVKIGEDVATKLDDDDPNTGPLQEVAKAIASSLSTTIDDVESLAETTGNALSDASKKTLSDADAIKTKIETLVSTKESATK